jgi:GTP-binding protein
VDKRLARYIADQHKACIVVVNKWDLAADRASTEEFGEYIDQVLPGLSYAPISFITASEGKNMQSLLDLATELHKQLHAKVTTSELNKVIQAIVTERAPSARRKVGLPKIYYGTQISNNPPTIVLFVNNPSFVDDNYQRFIINRFRDLLPFAEVPIRLLLRHHREKDHEDS